MKEITMKINFFVLENIYTPPMEGFLIEPPPPLEILVIKYWSLRPSQKNFSSKFSMTRHGEKIDIFLNDSRLK